MRNNSMALHVLVTLLCAMPLLSCGAVESYQGKSTDRNDRPYRLARELGHGFNSFTEEETGRCVRKGNVIERDLGSWEQIPFQQVTTRQELNQALNLVDASVLNGSEVLDELNQIASETSVHEHVAVFVLGRFFVASSTSLENAEVDDFALGIDSNEEFLRRCGDKFVGAVKNGYGIVGVLTIPASSSADLRLVEDAMKDSEKRVEFLGERPHHLRTYMRGVKRPVSEGLEGLLDVMGTMLEQTNDGSLFQPVELRSTLFDYHLSSNWHHLFDVKQVERRRTLVKVMSSYHRYLSLKASLGYIEKNRDQFAKKVDAGELDVQETDMYIQHIMYQVDQNLALLDLVIDKCRSYDMECKPTELAEIDYYAPVWEADEVNESTDIETVEDMEAAKQEEE